MISFPITIKCKLLSLSLSLFDVLLFFFSFSWWSNLSTHKYTTTNSYILSFCAFVWLLLLCYICCADVISSPSYRNLLIFFQLFQQNIYPCHVSISPRSIWNIISPFAMCCIRSTFPQYTCHGIVDVSLLTKPPCPNPLETSAGKEKMLRTAVGLISILHVECRFRLVERDVGRWPGVAGVSNDFCRLSVLFSYHYPLIIAITIFQHIQIQSIIIICNR